MNQSELIEKVAQATELNQATAGQAVKAVVNAILDGLLAGGCRWPKVLMRSKPTPPDLGTLAFGGGTMSSNLLCSSGESANLRSLLR
jgi:hypothetical protein